MNHATMRIWKVTTLDFTLSTPELKHQRVEAAAVKVNDLGYLCFLDLAGDVVRIVREWNEVELLDE